MIRLHLFAATLSDPNGLQDEYPDNDTYTTQINLPDFYDEPFIIQLKTNNQAYRYSLEVRDVLGNVLISRNNLENNTVYRDTLNFSDGCYTIELIDQEDMGLTYWAYPEQGYGYLRLFDYDSVMIKHFNRRFWQKYFLSLFSLAMFLTSLNPTSINSSIFIPILLPMKLLLTLRKDLVMLWYLFLICMGIDFI